MTKRTDRDQPTTSPYMRLSRRSLLRATGLGAGALVVGGGALSSCADGRKGSEVAGKLKASLHISFRELDPTVAISDVTIAMNDLIYESLYRANPFPPYKISPELAAELPREITPTNYRIRLREGVTFHDGSPLTAADVVFTVKRIQDPKVQNTFIKPFFELIKDVRAVSRHEVEFELREPTTLLPQRLKLLRVLSKSAVEASDDALKLAPVGSGPYQVVSAVSEQSITLKRFAKYSGKRELHFDDLEFGVVADPNARVAGLRTGQVDVILSVPASAFNELKNVDGVEAAAVPGPWSTDIFFNCAKPPFNDVRARRAVLYAIDRDSITKSTFFGLAEAGWSGFLRPDNPDYAKPDIIYRYDPEYAKKLLAEAGLAGRPIPIDVPLGSNIDYLRSQGPILEQNLKDVGFRPNITPAAFTAVVKRLSAGDYHLSMGTGARALDPTAEFDLRFHYKGGFPESTLHWKGEELARLRKLIDGAQSATDEATFKQRLAEAQNLLQEQVPHSRPHWLHTLTAWSDKLEGFRPLPAGGLLLDGVRKRA